MPGTNIPTDVCCTLKYVQTNLKHFKEITIGSTIQYKVKTLPVLSDIAMGKPAAQSSIFLNYSAELAVDGNRGTDIYQDLCSHTDTADTNPWWRVDLQAVYSIKTVRIINRGIDKFKTDLSDRLRDVTVTVGLTDIDIGTTCGFFAGPGTLSQLVVIDCPTLPFGRYVKISMTTEYLSLCEVDVFGVKE
ncbi:fucolectin-like [Crassostrea angulata]|uniref:fucolectin-like n=1 Tax=Magallana angulata TaxID=2784310 RepID=UPI0022B1D944|nr:fucolectin-like [Crassostrea angulata]